MAEVSPQSYRLVAQPDRRQRADRRSGWRGGRRASDLGVLNGTSIEDGEWAPFDEDDLPLRRPQKWLVH